MTTHRTHGDMTYWPGPRTTRPPSPFWQNIIRAVRNDVLWVREYLATDRASRPDPPYVR